MEKFAPLNLNREELIEYTPEWKGERFPDGRPRVPDDIIERMKQVTVTQAWGTLRGDGYNWQYEGGCSAPIPARSWWAGRLRPCTCRDVR